jgi:hypothetical protein
MDADKNLIPIVEGDQGEGFRDIFEEETIKKKKDVARNLHKLQQQCDEAKAKTVLKRQQ